MAERLLLRQIIRRPATVKIILTKLVYEQKCWYTAASDGENYDKEKNTNQWLILPPFNPAPDASSIGKKLYGRPDETNASALNWILKCCPHLPRSLVQKLFRLRQVRKQSSSAGSKDQRPRRVGAKDLMDIGDRICLPKSVDDKSHPTVEEKNQSFSSEEERRFVQSLELYKDSAIIVINKPPGMPVQGGVGIRRSLDELAAKYLRYDCMEPPRLVHRLDRDSTGILVMGRTQLSTTVLHSVFREKTIGASNDILGSKRILHKRYWALVIGSPRRRQGSVSVPLIKVVVDNGKSERITVADNSNRLSGQHAVTDYRVIASSPSGYTWLELSPLTGRKHQLRVHCAEVLGTPIVGDYKYGRQAHKKIGHYLESASDHLKLSDMPSKDEKDTELESGSISDEQFSLHLHCKEMVVPDISVVLQNGNISDVDSARIRDIVLRAPLPAHMQRSWDLLSSNHNF
ncbi:RNA pseudouridine synthase 4, mitochondrial-like [Salvia splendens]|uniref:RNA pseudouridine synthase 4, mitochondrial-like n=1 Tax=Salvia splendens TaxID=180675 RepID=UPI001C25C106|nr:RNA pseudouridine synthase 4, mitochondrial-like [Salvia splendens]